MMRANPAVAGSGDVCKYIRGNFFSLIKFVAIGHYEGSERRLLGKDRDPVSRCKAFVKSCCYVVVGFVSCI